MRNATTWVRAAGRTFSVSVLAGFLVTSACSKDPVATLPVEPAEMALSATRMFDVFSQPVMNHFRNTTFPNIAAAQVAGSGPQRVPHDGLIPTNLFGKTFTWNAGLQAYAESPRVGAPVNGVRYVLYQQQGGNNGPVLPLVEVGTIDFIDQGNVQALSLGVIINTAANTVAQYNIDGSRAVATVALADGVARDEAATPTMMSFDLNISTNPQAGTNSTVGEFISSDGTRVIYSFNLIQGADQTTLRFEKGASDIYFQLGAGAGSGTIEIDGVVVANVAPGSITPVTGSELTPEDLAALVAMRGIIQRIQAVTILVLIPFNLLF